MKKYIVKLNNWDFDTSEEIEAPNQKQAKGIYIKKYLRAYTRDAGYPQNTFFQLLSVSLSHS